MASNKSSPNTNGNKSEKLSSVELSDLGKKIATDIEALMEFVMTDNQMKQKFESILDQPDSTAQMRDGSRQNELRNLNFELAKNLNALISTLADAKSELLQVHLFAAPVLKGKCEEELAKLDEMMEKLTDTIRNLLTQVKAISERYR